MLLHLFSGKLRGRALNKDLRKQIVDFHFKKTAECPVETGHSAAVARISHRSRAVANLLDGISVRNPG
jgi:hypothetical protein